MKDDSRIVKTELPGSIGKVAARQLALKGVTKLSQLVQYSESELLAIHGVGPKAIRLLGLELASLGLAFRSSPKL